MFCTANTKLLLTENRDFWKLLRGKIILSFHYLLDFLICFIVVFVILRNFLDKIYLELSDFMICFPIISPNNGGTALPI